MKSTAWYLVAFVMLTGSVMHGQPMRMGDERPFERIEQWKKVRLIEVLDLKEEQSVRFFARFNEHESKMRELAKQKDEVLDKLERLVRNHADGKEIEKVFPEETAANENLAGENLRFFNSTTDILSSEQRAKLLLFERHFERELREAMREAQRRRHGPGER
jgi:Spy/CpxP family protein refolding chaperone